MKAAERFDWKAGYLKSEYFDSKGAELKLIWPISQKSWYPLADSYTLGATNIAGFPSVPPSVDQLLRKAKRHAKNGETELAAQHYRGILEKFPQNRKAQAGLDALQQPDEGHIDGLIQLLRQGQHQQVVMQGEALQREFQNSPVIPKVLAESHLAMGFADKACLCFSRALELEPNDAQTNNNLGIVLQQLGRHTEAVKYFARAIEIKPSYVDALANLGNGLKDVGESQAAIECYQKVLKNRPQDADTHNNLGAIFNELGNTTKAINSLSTSLEIRPKNALAHNNLAVALHREGKHDEAISHFRQSIALAPQNGEFWQAYSELLMGYSPTEYDQRLADNFLELLNRKTIARPAHLAKPIWQLLNLHPDLEQALVTNEQEHSVEFLLKISETLADNPLLLNIMALCPIYDLKLETFFRRLRTDLLHNIEECPDDEALLKLASAIALQCFTNEYLYGEGTEETTLIESLETSLEKEAVAGSLNPMKNSIKLACLASYRPLHNYAWADTIEVPTSLNDLFRRQLTEVREETSILETIQSLGSIADQVSKQVQAQYEENPYPRWVNTALTQQPLAFTSLAKSLQLKLDGSVDNLATNPHILIAGCGTGQQALVAATRFSQSKVLAIDLSLSSLSYAIRKTRELGVGNIDYMQADILSLAALDAQFDLIESLGVLHHMAEPMAGWKVLASKLKPGGCMKIGLYSELARRSVVAAREAIADLDLSSPKDAMLAFRAKLQEDNPETAELHSNLSNFSDFYSTSELRDLLFHVSEHRFTLPQIKACLQELNLTFAGFEFWDSTVNQRFSSSHPDAEALYNLDAWHEYELANPDTFRGMYQFWAQKPSSS